MTDNSINQFGAVLSFAIDLEDIVAGYYESMESESEPVLNRTEISERMQDALRRKKNLERARRDISSKVLEEDLKAIDPYAYLLDSHATNLSGISAVHKIASSFYEDAGNKVNNREAKQLFRRHSKEHTRLQYKL